MATKPDRIRMTVYGNGDDIERMHAISKGLDRYGYETRKADTDTRRGQWASDYNVSKAWRILTQGKLQRIGNQLVLVLPDLSEVEGVVS